MVNEHIIDHHPSLLKLTSRIHPLIFLWTSKRFIFSPECFLNFFLKYVFCTIVAERFQTHGVKITGKCICESKSWISSFLLISLSKNLRQDLIITTPRRRKLTISLKQYLLYFSSAEREEDYGAEKITKIKIARVLVTNFDKFYHFCNHCISGFCSVVQYFRFKQAEM